MISHALCSITSLPLYPKWHPPYLCHHNDSIDGLRPTLCMTSHPPYVCHLLHSTPRHIHSLWLHTIVVITLHALHSWHHTPYIWHHTHGNTNVVSAIWPTISNSASTVYVSSSTWYHLYHTHSLYDITHIIRVTSYSVCMPSQQLFMTLYHYMYNITPSIFMTSYPKVCYHHTALMTTQRLYLTSHLPFLTPQPLYLCHHTNGTHICINVALYQRLPNKCVSHHTWHTYDILPNLHHITFTLYDINDHGHWHHKHCIHDIRSPLYDITSTLLDITPLYIWHQVHCIWPHVHCICVITPTLLMTSQPLYKWYHIQYICDIISPLFRT